MASLIALQQVHGSLLADELSEPDPVVERRLGPAKAVGSFVVEPIARIES
jgi:hypothetical protein